MAIDATGTPTTLGIPKFLTSADAPSGNGGNAQMDSIDALIQARVNRPASVAAGDVPVWNGTTFVVPTGSRNGAKYLRDDGSWAYAVPQVISRAGATGTSTPLLTITNTAAETDLFGTAGSGVSIPANALGTSGTIRFSIFADVFNNTGGSVTVTPAVRYGSFVTVNSTGASLGTSGTTHSPTVFTGTVQALGTALQAVYGLYQQGPTTFAVPGVGTTTTFIGAIDSTVAQNFRVTITPSVASASFSMKVWAVYVEVL